MSKGMTMEQLRAELDSDAQKRCDEQAKSIKRMIGDIKSRDAVIENYRRLETEWETERTAMRNRCYAFTKGALCLLCPYRITCRARERLVSTARMDGQEGGGV